MKPHEIIELMGQLNHEIFEAFGEEDHCHTFSYETNDMVDVIKFDDYVLWDSENDEREYIGESNEYESLEGHIKKMFYEYAERMDKYANVLSFGGEIKWADHKTSDPMRDLKKALISVYGRRGKFIESIIGTWLNKNETSKRYIGAETGRFSSDTSNIVSGPSGLKRFGNMSTKFSYIVIHIKSLRANMNRKRIDDVISETEVKDRGIKSTQGLVDYWNEYHKLYGIWYVVFDDIEIKVGGPEDGNN